jgi:K+:H+ antiporter
MRKNLVLYATILLVFGIGIYFILYFGSELDHRPVTERLKQQDSSQSISPVSNIGKFLSKSIIESFSILLLQLIVILSVAHVTGNLFRKIGQPAVIGEMVAGILLGPSLLGMIAPDIQSFIFPVNSLGTLKLLSQIGVILFLFCVGIELDLQHLRKKADTAVLVSHASILFPFLLGLLLSLFLYDSLAPANTPFIAFSLFIGIALSITAFPVLARIIKERGLSGSYLGNIAIACAAVDDVSAWCVLAIVIAIARTGEMTDSIATIGLTVIFVSFMLFVIRPAIDKFFIGKARKDDTWSNAVLTRILMFLFVSAWITEVIGIHALFGAFLAGVCVPRLQGLRLFLRERLDMITSVFLLPLFFAFSGLRTQLDLLNDWQSWLLCLAIIAVAITGKLGSSSVIAKWTGMGWRDSLSLGALLNTRGLIELVVLNIGYDMGILSRKIFAMMVLMALITTFMAGPLLSLFAFRKKRKPEIAEPIGT